MAIFEFAASIAGGTVFGFLVAWLLGRSKAEAEVARFRAEAQADTATLRERVAAKDALVAQLSLENQHLDQLRDDNTRLRAVYEQFGPKLDDAHRQAEEKLAMMGQSHERLIEAARASYADRARAEEERTRDLESRLAKAESELAAAREENVALRAAEAAVTTSGGMLEEAREKLAASFQTLSNEALRNSNQAFLDLAKATLDRYHEGARGELGARQQAIDELVRPLREQLDRVNTSIAGLEQNRVAAYAGLSEQVTALISTQQQLRSETQGLVNALRSPAVRGRWGEIQLRRVVELAGMIEHCDFEQQTAVESDDGSLRPDLIIHLPNDRRIVVDAKVSLKAYLEALDARDEAGRERKLKEHAKQVREHLNKLGGKRYWSQFPNAPEFAVAFLPAETIFSAALEQDPSLIEFGAGQRVILATPTTLIALLKAVAYGWQQQQVAESARHISALGQTMYDRLRNFAVYMEEVRKNLARTVDSYNRAAGSLESRVLVTARRLRELGIAASEDEIPEAEQIESAPRRLPAAEDGPAPEQMLLTELPENEAPPAEAPKVMTAGAGALVTEGAAPPPVREEPPAQPEPEAAALPNLAQAVVREEPAPARTEPAAAIAASGPFSAFVKVR